MKTLIFILAILLVSCGGSSNMHTVGILVGVEEDIPVAESFINNMENLGYTQDKNISYIVKIGKSDSNLMEEICNDFVKNKVDLILTITHGATMTAKKATEGTDIPVVFSYAITNHGDLVNSIAEPGGNITGVRYPIPDMAIKRFEFLLDIDPTIKQILLPHKTAYPPAMIVIEGLEDIAKEKNVTLLNASFDSLDDMESYFDELEKSGTVVDAIIVLPEPFVYSDRGWAAIRSYSLNMSIPIAANSFHMVRAGSLFAYTNKDEEMGELAAPIVHKIFSGTAAGKIPVATPNVYLHINRARARELGLEFPAGMLKLAEKIIDNE